MRITMTFIAAAAAMMLFATSCDKAGDEIKEEQKQEEQKDKPVDDGTILHLDDILIDGNATVTEKKEWYEKLSNKGYAITNCTESASDGYTITIENKSYNMLIGEEWVKVGGQPFGVTDVVYQLSADKKDKCIKEIESKFSCKMEDLTDYINKIYSEAGQTDFVDFYCQAQIKINGISYKVVFEKASNEPYAGILFQHYS